MIWNIENLNRCAEKIKTKITYLYFDMTGDKKEGIYRIFNENKNTNFECICKSEAFSLP